MIVETGVGLPDSNSYATVALADAYLSSLGRLGDNGWDTATQAQKEASLIAGTQYLDVRWGPSLAGTKVRHYPGSIAISEFDASPTIESGDVLIIGNETYEFVAGTTTGRQIPIVAPFAAQRSHIIHVINAQSNYVSASVGEGTSIRLTSRAQGAESNNIAISSDVFTVVAFSGGADAQSQSLEFPRSVFDGVPREIRRAAIEYAVRALTTSLLPDPVVDDRGRAVVKVREKVGPLESETQYAAGSAIANLYRDYPLADDLVAGFLKGGSEKKWPYR